MDNHNVFNSKIRGIVLRHSIASAAIAIIPGLGPTTATFNQSVMLGIISDEMGIKLSKSKTWHVVKKVGIALLAGKAVSMGASFLPGFGSVVSAAIEGGSTYAVAYVYVKMMSTLSDRDVLNMSDEEFKKIVDKYTDENKDDIKRAFEEGKKFYKENKDSVSKEEVEQIKASVLAQSQKEANDDSKVVIVDECDTIKCSKCGNDLGEGMKFCPLCGTPVSVGNIENQKQDDKLDVEKMARRLHSKSRGVEGVYFYSLSKKDDSKIEKAKKGYNKLCLKKDIIMCYDDTFFGSATDGFLLATDGIYIHDLGKDTIFVSADNIKGAKLLENKEDKNAICMECPSGIKCNIPVTMADTNKMLQFLSNVLNEVY